MEIIEAKIKVGDILKGYVDKEDEGVFAYEGRLTIRPSYQREFIYDTPQEEAVIHTVLKGFPLNTMYWAKLENETYEVLDGQQRTLSLMHFLSHKFSINIENLQYYEDSLTPDQYNLIVEYPLSVYICKGSETEKLAWFRVVNIAGEKLTDQEIKNSIYTGPWLQDAKIFFSKKNCVAKKLSERYITGNPNRQELLEKALKGICEYQGEKNITHYMSKHRNDKDADELWQYFQKVINWVTRIFPEYYQDMKGLDWCHLYNKYSNNDYNSSLMKENVKKLHNDEDVQKHKGIYEYLLSKDKDPFAERLLNIRQFTVRDKQKAYERQNGMCAICNLHFEFENMEGDHIKPWSKGGVTELENCQMLCKECNRKKQNNF